MMYPWPSPVKTRPPAVANVFGPADLRIGLGGDYLAIGSVQCIKEAIAVSLKDRLDSRAVFLEVDQHRVLGRIPIMDVVRSELIMPLQFASVRIDGQHTT